MNTEKKRRTFTREEKQKLFEEFTKSWLSIQKFAALKGIGESTLMRWRREFKSAACDTESITTSPKMPTSSLKEDSPSLPLFVELTSSETPRAFVSHQQNCTTFANFCFMVKKTLVKYHHHFKNCHRFLYGDNDSAYNLLAADLLLPLIF